jgi:hypothetical protein
MPAFEKLHQELKDKDVVILAVDVGEGKDLVNEFIGKEKYTLPVLLAEGTDVTAKYGVNAYPTLVSVDSEGKVVEYLIGSRSEAELREVIARARAGASPPPAKAPTAPYVRSAKPLPAPKQLSPAEGAIFDHYPRVTTLVWSPVPGASAYVVEWDFYDGGRWASERGGSIATTARVTDPVHTMSFIGAHRGRWRVTALDEKGETGEPGQWREFVYTR